MPDLLTVLGGGGGALTLAKIAYDWFIRSGAGNAQAIANKELYNMLREDMKLVRRELRLVKKQLVILEKLAAEAGIDIHKAYKDAGIYEEVDDRTPD
jgi:hypothetical protein